MKGKVAFLALSAVLLASTLPIVQAQSNDLGQRVTRSGGRNVIAPPPGDDELQAKFQYAAKFVCGLNPQSIERILPGLYATAINIHNPSNGPVAFQKTIALTFPPAEQEPGAVSDFISHTLERGQAIEVDCGEIPIEFFPDAQLPPYVKGFLVIESQGSLDVTAVYTAGVPPNPNLPFLLPPTIDVEQINERILDDESEDSDSDSDSD